MSKIPYQQALKSKGYKEQESLFLDRLSSLGVSGYTAQLEGIDTETLKSIPELQIAAPALNQHKANNKDKENSTSDLTTSSLTIDTVVEILEAEGIDVKPEDVTDIVEILGLKEPFPQSELSQITELICWGYAMQLQQNTVAQERGIAAQTQQAMIHDAQQQGIMDAFVREIAYSQTFIEAQELLAQERQKALKKTQPTAISVLSEVVETGKQKLETEKKNWISSSEQRQSQQANNRKNLRAFLEKRSS